MDSIVWPYHTSEWLPHIYLNSKENILLHSNFLNLYYDNNLNFMDPILLPCHTSEWLPHISINYKDNFLNHSNILTFFIVIILILWIQLYGLIIHLNGFLIST